MAAKKPSLSSDDAELGKPSAPPSADEVTPAENTNPARGTAMTSDDAGPEVVYVTAPEPPRKKGNRLLGSLFALIAALVYGLLLAGVLALSAQILIGPGVSVDIFGSTSFYFPVVLFFIGMVLVVLVVNRAGWWSHLLGSVVVGLIVYFGTVGLILLMAGVVAKTQAEAAIEFHNGLLNPLVIVAALLAREVAIWSGAVISWRGKKVKARNVVAKEDFDREQAELVAK